MEEIDNQNLSPRNNNFLIGFEEEEKFLLEAWKKNTLHNSWLFSGVEGIGKATLAYKFAKFVLFADEKDKDKYTSLDIPPQSAVNNLVSSTAIKDGEQLAQEDLKELKKSANIKVDEVRTINEFLSKRSGNDGWRVVIIDSIDDMNTSSANAILKTLEEPPHKALMLLISHNPNRLLPTIKSRCAKLNLKPLSEENVASLLRRYRPNMSEKEIKELTPLSSGSIGKALLYADNDALEVYHRLSQIIYAKEKFALSDLLEFCNTYSSDEESYALVQELILKFIAENIEQASDVNEFARSWEETIKIFNETAALNLDKKQALMNIIINLTKRM